MKILYFTDIHLKGVNPKSRKDNYLEAICKKLTEVGEIGNTLKVDCFLCGGDLFDLYDPAYSVTNKLISIFKGYRAPIFTIIGSHDYDGYNLTTLPRTAIGNLIQSGVLKSLKEFICPIVRGTENKSLVSITGFNHSIDMDKNLNVYKEKSKDTAIYKIGVYHSMLLDKPFPFCDFTLLSDVAKVTSFDCILSGHYHPGYKTEVINVKDNKAQFIETNTFQHSKRDGKDILFCNPGAISRLTKTERKPKCAVLTILKDWGISIQEIYLKSVVSDVFIEQENTTTEIELNAKTSACIDRMNEAIQHFEVASPLDKALFVAKDLKKNDKVHVLLKELINKISS